MSDYQFKLVKLEGDFIWHDHQDTDETFIVLDGALRIDFRDGAATRSRPVRCSSFPGVSSISLTRKTRLNYCSSSPVVSSIPAAPAAARTAQNDVWI